MEETQTFDIGRLVQAIEEIESKRKYRDDDSRFLVLNSFMIKARLIKQISSYPTLRESGFDKEQYVRFLAEDDEKGFNSILVPEVGYCGEYFVHPDVLVEVIERIVRNRASDLSTLLQAELEQEAEYAKKKDEEKEKVRRGYELLRIFFYAVLGNPLKRVARFEGINTFDDLIKVWRNEQLTKSDGFISISSITKSHLEWCFRSIERETEDIIRYLRGDEKSELLSLDKRYRPFISQREVNEAYADLPEYLLPFRVELSARIGYKPNSNPDERYEQLKTLRDNNGRNFLQMFLDGRGKIDNFVINSLLSIARYDPDSRIKALATEMLGIYERHKTFQVKGSAC